MLIASSVFWISAIDTAACTASSCAFAWPRTDDEPAHTTPSAVAAARIFFIRSSSERVSRAELHLARRVVAERLPEHGIRAAGDRAVQRVQRLPVLLVVDVE